MHSWMYCECITILKVGYFDFCGWSSPTPVTAGRPRNAVDHQGNAKDTKEDTDSQPYHVDFTERKQTTSDVLPLSITLSITSVHYVICWIGSGDPNAVMTRMMMTKIEIMNGGIFTAFRDPVLFSTSVIIKKAFFVMYLSWKLKDLLLFYDKSEVLLSKAKPIMHENPFLSFFVLCFGFYSSLCVLFEWLYL